MNHNDIYYMNEAYKEAKRAYTKNEIPIGVVIVNDNKIISRAHNLRDSSNVVTRHAEIIAIEKANKKLGNWRLIGATLYSTLEPCKMCTEVIKETKISKVVYAAKREGSSTSFIQIDHSDIVEKCSEIIKSKFKEIRDK